MSHAGLRFFPLLPLVARSLAWPIGGHVGPVIIVLVEFAALAYAALLHRLVLTETEDGELARRTIWIALLAPPALCMVFGYAEAIFALLAVVVFLTARSRRWLVAGLAAVAASLARLRDETGRTIRLAIEPEPFCLLETTAETVAFFAQVWDAAEAAGQGSVAREHLGDRKSTRLNSSHRT